jgi:formylmethanofuran dehydrogenase subunit E
VSHGNTFLQKSVIALNELVNTLCCEGELPLPNEEYDLALDIENAEKLHGHLGPFLVIGVRAGILAKRVLNASVEENAGLRVTARLPLSTPFSCILDGIQTATQCTVGNQKLRIDDYKERIIVYFEQRNLDKALRIHVNPKIIEELVDRYSEGASNEELAQKIASMPESQLFIMEKR